jgi:hypothetical protein
MRISAAVLVILGSILTVTIVWAPVGLLMMGFGLTCGLIADRRDARSSDTRPAQFAQAKSWFTPAKTRAPSSGSRGVSSSQHFSSIDEGSSVPGLRSPDWPLALSDQASNLESSAVFSEQAIPSTMDPGTTNYAEFEHGADQAPDNESLLPQMISLLAKVVRKGPGPGAEPGDENLQDHNVDANTREWAETVDEPTYSSGDRSTRSSRDERVVAHLSSVDLNEVAQMSEAEKESAREAQQLMELLKQMSKPNAAGS